MRVYAVVEGKTEGALYTAWLGHAFPGSTPVARIEDVGDAGLYLISNMGYPGVLDSVRAAVVDLGAYPGRFDLLLVALDADEATADARRADVVEALSGCPVATVIAVQDCCVETWLLGNPRFVRSHDGAAVAGIGGEGLARFRAHYDVRTADPEAMAAPAGYPMSIMDFHHRYLRAAFAARGLAYHKGRPGVAVEAKYAAELVRRHTTTGHLASFGRFLGEMRAAGGGGPFAE